MAWGRHWIKTGLLPGISAQQQNHVERELCLSLLLPLPISAFMLGLSEVLGDKELDTLMRMVQLPSSKSRQKMNSYYKHHNMN